MGVRDDAARFMCANARRIERALFDGAGEEELRAVLGAYRNPDGGFGHALEPDADVPDANGGVTRRVRNVLQTQEPIFVAILDHKPRWGSWTARRSRVSPGSRGLRS